MKNLLIFVFCLLTYNAFSQTQEETENWIKQKLELFYYTNPLDGLDNKLSVEFKNGNMIFYEVKNMSGVTISYQTVIPIKQLNQIMFSEKESTIWIIFTTKGTNEIKVTDDFEIEPELMSKTEIIMSKDVKQNNMQNRLKNAFSDLVKNYGGSTQEAY